MSAASKPLENVNQHPRSAAWRERLLVAALAGALGLALVYVAGFAEIEAIHDAAHDVRHSAALPCH